jgi:hypothetical protein
VARRPVPGSPGLRTGALSVPVVVVMGIVVGKRQTDGKEVGYKIRFSSACSARTAGSSAKGGIPAS